MKFKLKSSFKPAGSQPEAIKKIVKGLKENKRFQTLIGVTGSGKTFTMANIIKELNRPVLILAHNKTLAAQLYQEFKNFFPENRVEYFISYYDYYQPESYIPQRDMYIEKDAQINPKIEQLRLSATASVSSRKDVIIIASVSCIYALGNPANFKGLGFEIKKKEKVKRKELIKKLVKLQFERNDTELLPGRIRVKGNTIDVMPGYYDDKFIRIELWNDKIDRIFEMEKVTGNITDKFEYFFFFPSKHFVITEKEANNAINSITEELKTHLPNLPELEAYRLRKRTMYDLEMIKEMGYCKGIENYSRHFDSRKKGEKPYCLLDYFPKDFIIFIDESHQTLPQVKAMYKGDYSRKKNLIEYGFRLPSAFDNRPLKFNEFEAYLNNTVFVSATPGKYELKHSQQIVEQIIRPTGLVDPIVTVKPTKNQIQNLQKKIQKTIKRKDRVLITTLTKKLAEELSEYLANQGIKTRYLHSEIDTLERTELIRQLRAGDFDVLVGINLLREGLDLPEVGFIAIMDADKEGFLRDTKSLIQIIGRAARNVNSSVTLYADKITDSIKAAISETERRRNMQIRYNKKHNITPKTIKKPIPEKKIELRDVKSVPRKNIPKLLTKLEKEMNTASEELEFERAIVLRDRIKLLQQKLKTKE